MLETQASAKVVMCFELGHLATKTPTLRVTILRVRRLNRPLGYFRSSFIGLKRILLKSLFQAKNQDTNGKNVPEKEDGPLRLLASVRVSQKVFFLAYLAINALKP